MPHTNEHPELESQAGRFKALGHPIRLAILRLIVQGPESGTPAGEIQEHVGIPASTLSHHLACLAEAELVEITREGSFLMYQADFKTLHALTGYLWKDCCGRTPKGPDKPEVCCGVKVRTRT